MKPLRNDCFALPPGVNWTPVDEALERLRSRLHPVVGVEREVPLCQLNGRILAGDVYAPRAHPPSSNSAVDGYAFAGPLTEVPCVLPLVDGRSAAKTPGSVRRALEALSAWSLWRASKRCLVGAACRSASLRRPRCRWWRSG